MGGEPEGGGGTRVERQVGRGGGERVGGGQLPWSRSVQPEQRRRRGRVKVARGRGGDPATRLLYSK